MSTIQTPWAHSPPSRHSAHHYGHSPPIAREPLKHGETFALPSIQISGRTHLADAAEFVGSGRYVRALARGALPPRQSETASIQGVNGGPRQPFSLATTARRLIWPF